MKSSPRNGFVPLQFSIFLAPKYSKDSFVRKPCCSSHRPLFPCVVCCHKLTSNLNNYSRRNFLNDWVWTSILLTGVGCFLGDSASWAKEEKQSVPASVANQVETYKDLIQGYKILRPLGWNEFSGQRNQYDIKWQDIIQPLEVVMIATVDIGKNKSIKDLGSPMQIGEKLAKNRKLQLVTATEKETGGIPAYEIELKGDPLHQLVLLTASKSKLFNVTATCSESRWSNREKLLRTVVESFVPSL
ncbi:photosystem II oxygen-evolving complex 23kDa protein [Galdieria sulphuraria]|uniref:Chloroplast photosystem II 23 kDa n=1 Tax=Galdieria sulphuraria TaxID=130081 RepID=D4NY62_GALSU|nr:photosystem II oxygen-evolving complex 23kDa protein [Galdieria sulphuraria]ADD54620.1 chloroplast photosystem II 23 kDa precursor [Galdieria sulphuraria]EME32636.1 photosystem II oxygen-evolving complex 23kDa protein [Galdieria sulphuraria]|eukprot:XP_005709156.1 photosystem II oxygen-evolving complex 23kDa protein [Galdieria sulphuraria]